MKTVTCLTLVALLATSVPAFADQRHGGSHNNGGRDAALVIGGAILGAVITDAARDRQDRRRGDYDYDDRPVYRDRDGYNDRIDYPRYRYRDHTCWDHVTTDWDRYGRPYRIVERICR